MDGDPLLAALLGLMFLGFFAAPLAIPLLIGAVWGARWLLWAIGSLLLVWGAFAWGTGVASFAAIDSLEEAEATLQAALLGAGAIVLLSAAAVGWRRNLKG